MFKKSNRTGVLEFSGDSCDYCDSGDSSDYCDSGDSSDYCDSGDSSDYRDSVDSSDYSDSGDYRDNGTVVTTVTVHGDGSDYRWQWPQ